MTNRIKAASQTIYANDTQLDRVQSLGCTARLETEDIKEVGNLDIIEVVDNVPTVDITVDANQYGSVKTLRKFARKNFDWGTLYIRVATSGTVEVSSGTFYIDEMKYTKATTTTPTLTWPTGANQNRIDVISIASNGTVTVTPGDATTGVPAVPNTPAGGLRIGLVQLQTNAASGAVALTDMHVLNVGDERTVALKDFEFAAVDFAVLTKEKGDNTTDDPVTRSMLLENCFVNRYDAAFSTNGLATESWSLEGDNKTHFLNTAGCVVTDRWAGNGTTSGFAFTYSATTRDNGKNTLKVYLYDKTTGLYADKAENVDFTTTTSGITFKAGKIPTANQTVVARYLSDPSGVPASTVFFKRNPEDLMGHPGVAGGLKHGQVEIYLSDDASNPVLRLQSVSVSSSLTRQPLYEIGHKRAYERPMDFPIPITIQVEATASDLKEFVRLCGKDFASVKEVSIDQFLKNLDLTIKVYREDDVARALAPALQSIAIKTMTIKDITLTDEGTEIRVEGNGTQTFSF
jgi:hypothetical protein